MNRIKKIIEKIINWLQTKKIVKQFMQFGFVGISNTLISIISYSILIFLGMHYLVANVISYILGTLNSFFWNNKYVFKVGSGEKRNIISSFFKMALSYAFTGIFLNSILSIFWIEIIGISEYFAPYFNMAITIPLNFILNKFWAMKTR